MSLEDFTSDEVHEIFNFFLKLPLFTNINLRLQRLLKYKIYFYFPREILITPPIIEFYNKESINSIKYERNFMVYEVKSSIPTKSLAIYSNNIFNNNKREIMKNLDEYFPNDLSNIIFDYLNSFYIGIKFSL